MTSFFLNDVGFFRRAVQIHLTSFRSVLLGKFNFFEQAINGMHPRRDVCASVYFDLQENMALVAQAPKGEELLLLSDDTYVDDVTVRFRAPRNARGCEACMLRVLFRSPSLPVAVVIGLRFCAG
jgi:hypothetical protein